MTLLIKSKAIIGDKSSHQEGDNQIYQLADRIISTTILDLSKLLVGCQPIITFNN